MRFPPDFLDEIRARVPISTIVGQRVTFDNKKSNPSRGDFWACCPFHSEKSASFHCEDPKGRYHCFGCHVSGDIFRFLCEKDGLSFPESVERLADIAGLKMPERDAASEQREKKKANLYDVMEAAAQIYSQKLQSDEGQYARHYLQERQLPEPMIKSFRLGFAPNQRAFLKDALLARGITLQQMEDCGLIGAVEDGATQNNGHYDRFRNRIMFPILDLRGRIVAFGGRALDKDARAKYLNSPETVLFSKGHMLYNAAEARKLSQDVAGKNSKPILVVEGYMDVIALAKAGFLTAVAPLGTALTDEQINLLWRMGANPILCFDGDDAGLKAAYRAAERILPLLKAGVSARFVLLPSGQDPDDVIKTAGAEGFTNLLDKSIPLAEFLWIKYTNGQQFNTPEDRAHLDRQLKQAIFTIKDESLRHYYMQDVRERLRQFFRPAYSKNFQNAKNNNGNYSNKGNYKNSNYGNNATIASKSLVNSALVRYSNDFIPIRESAILMTLASHPDLWYEDFELYASLEFQNQELAKLHSTMVQILSQWQPDDADAMKKLLIEKGQGAVLQNIADKLHKLGMFNAFPECPIEDAKTSLKQAIYLHQRAYNLHKQLRDIETQLLESADSQIFSLLSEVKDKLAETEAIDSIVEGYGKWRKDGRKEENH